MFCACLRVPGEMLEVDASNSGVQGITVDALGQSGRAKRRGESKSKDRAIRAMILRCLSSEDDEEQA